MERGSRRTWNLGFFISFFHFQHTNDIFEAGILDHHKLVTIVVRYESKIYKGFVANVEVAS